MITPTLAGAITGVLTDAANGLNAFIGVLQKDKIPVDLQTLTIKVKFLWSIQNTAKFSESSGISIWVFSASETFSMTDVTKQSLTTEMTVVMVPKPVPAAS